MRTWERGSGDHAGLRHRRVRGVRGRRLDRTHRAHDSSPICPAAIWNWNGPPTTTSIMTGEAVEVFSGEWDEGCRDEGLRDW